MIDFLLEQLEVHLVCVGTHACFIRAHDMLVSDSGSERMILWLSPGPERGMNSVGRDSNPICLFINRDGFFFLFFSFRFYFDSEADWEMDVSLPAHLSHAPPGSGRPA